MANPSYHEAYADKDSLYYEQERRELLPFVPHGIKRALDVGCGVGAFGLLLKRSANVEVWGIEPDSKASAVAAARIDRVIEGEFDADADALRGQTFDLITFNDVLEHMVNPEAALRKAAGLLSPTGIVLASIPNFRYFPNLWEICWRGEWEYKKSGILDSTHLRFFTRKSMARMFERTGYKVQAIHGIAPWRSRKLSVLNTLLLRRLEDTTFQAFVVVAKP